MVADAPRINQPTWEKIPLELRLIPRWVVWNWVEKSPGKWTKPPMQTSNYPAAVDTQAHLTTFEQAKAAVIAGRFHGVGFVFDGDYTGIDLDDCIDDFGCYSPIAEEFLALGGYSEISPSGTGLKFWFRGSNPAWNKKQANKEIYCTTRYFTVTGDALNGSRITDADDKFAAVVGKHFEGLRSGPTLSNTVEDWATHESDVEKARKALKSIPPHVAEERYTWVAVGLACKATSRELMNDWIEWSATAPTKFVSREDCEKEWASFKPRGDIGVGTLIRYAKGNMTDERIVDFSEIVKTHAQLRPIQIADILRKSEVANIISAAKVGKSFLVGDLAIATTTGGRWLGKQTTKGRVLVVDYELHRETLVSRYSKILATRNLQIEPDMLKLLALRGQENVDLDALASIIGGIQKDYYSLIIVDALYRIIPQGISENDNAGMLRIYNRIDRFAEQTGASWVVVHHSSKGDQSGKSTVDMGSGAGSINRAVDSVIAIKQHELPNHGVCEVQNRSFPSIDPFSIRFDYPCWYVADQVEAEVKTQKGRKKRDTAEAKSRILAELKDAAEPVPNSLVTEISGIPKESCRQLLYEMADNGIIQKVEKNGRIFWSMPQQ